MKEYGYTEYHARNYAALATDYIPARVISEQKSVYTVVSEFGETAAHLSGKYLHRLDEKGGKPAVGDFVVIQPSDGRAVIHDYLPRRTMFVRPDAFGAMGFQVVGANFDTVFICMSLNLDFNTARLERYLMMCRESGADTAVVLTKADLCADLELSAEICRAICGDIPVYAVSAEDGDSLSQLAGYFEPGKTVAAVGSSGVGKSTLVNKIAGRELMKTSAIREDDSRGRHTTTHRELIKLPNGGLYMDTPGMREVGLLDAGDGVTELFSDIDELAANCRFSDCKHKSEPGCAVLAAISSGSLDRERLVKYEKLQREARYSLNRAVYLAMRQKRFAGK